MASIFKPFAAKRAVLLLLSVAAMFFACSEAQAQNLLTNGGFEGTFNAVPPQSPGHCTGYVASSWYDNTGWDSAATVAYAQDTATFYAGTSSQKISVSSGFSQLQQNIPFQAGRYSATIYVKASTPTWVSWGLRDLQSPYTYYALTTFRATSTWAPITVTGITPAIGGTLVFSTEVGGTVWVDSASTIFQATNPTAIALTTPTSAIPSTMFGLHPMHLASQGQDIPWPQTAFGYARQHDCAPTWASVEPSNGTFSWTKLDSFVNAAIAGGQKVDYCFSQTPTWATTDTNLDQYGYVGGNGVPSSISYWSTFVSALVTRYKGEIAAYEIWNEPNSGFWDGTPAQLVSLEQAAAPIIHSTDPAALVVSPGIIIAQQPNYEGWYEQYIEAGGCSYSDVLACHLYNPMPEDDLQDFPSLKSLFATYGLSKKPIWNTETGWGYAGIGTGNGQQPMATTEAYVAREYVLNWALGIQSFDWYGWSDVSNIGVTKDASGNYTVLTGGATAYQQVQSWLNGATMTACKLDTNGNWVATITRPNSYIGWIVWNNDQTYSYPLPADATTEVNLSGGTTSLASVSTVPVNSSPVLIYGTVRPPASVSLAASFNLIGITNDTAYQYGNLDGSGYSYSAQAIGSQTLTVQNVPFTLGSFTDDTQNAIKCTGQTIALPSAKYSSLEFLGCACNGAQASQTFTVTYTSGNNTVGTFNLSDWGSAGTNTVASQMSYRNSATSGKSAGTFDIYEYAIPLSTGKTVKSLILPNNANDKLLAVTMVP